MVVVVPSENVAMQLNVFPSFMEGVSGHATDCGAMMKLAAI
jgi:hypothetical protein